MSKSTSSPKIAAEAEHRSVDLSVDHSVSKTRNADDKD